ncbi:SIS domain-containing protein [Sinorhizobium medicae]|uniref:RpiR family transcriptional regulator n=3 Tax=Sinorhizobium medicae TaxID=110321 RepID=A0A508WMP3_9HYPH|nr:MurR/RpiR family transcriptional regulator [Sinorhizobium medicae]ABR62378.1 transcriptional regulator, RpiR family [Sinorhizobium medicae WSM419]MBO1940744.1 MurR/RpiR family transcriptional regulator [Sinorhizobium medicae]MBO1963987.1 MurR/RpiR family transcriptional regulator [Sinorhizobium medicae]MDX0407256.1 SIS domain-containing protein [Sinorhizobium medicae]MDX0412801.1 SIS domain-containing protein [Sinorhizobium medicae]
MPMPETTNDVPQDFETLKAVILERKAQLPKRLKQVAAYSLDNPDEIAFGTAASIATSADVQPSTLVRFAQHFGFEGFSSLQQIFRARLRERTPGYEERLKALRQNDHNNLESGSIFNGFVAAAHRSLENIATSVDPHSFERAVDILAKANTIYLIAKRRSYPISSYMAYAFGKLKVKYQHVGTAAGIDDDMLAMANREDAAFAVSFSPYASESANQARLLANRKVPVVSLTDSAFSPLAESSKVWFELVEADHAGFRSLSASMAFAMALTVAIAEKRRRIAEGE